VDCGLCVARHALAGAWEGPSRITGPRSPPTYGALLRGTTTDSLHVRSDDRSTGRSAGRPGGRRACSRAARCYFTSSKRRAISVSRDRGDEDKTVTSPEVSVGGALAGSLPDGGSTWLRGGPVVLAGPAPVAARARVRSGDRGRCLRRGARGPLRPRVQAMVGLPLVPPAASGLAGAADRRGSRSRRRRCSVEPAPESSGGPVARRAANPAPHADRKTRSARRRSARGQRGLARAVQVPAPVARSFFVRGDVGGHTRARRSRPPAPAPRRGVAALRVLRARRAAVAGCLPVERSYLGRRGVVGCRRGCQIPREIPIEGRGTS